MNNHNNIKASFHLSQTWSVTPGDFASLVGFSPCPWTWSFTPDSCPWLFLIIAVIPLQEQDICVLVTKQCRQSAAPKELGNRDIHRRRKSWNRSTSKSSMMSITNSKASGGYRSSLFRSTRTPARTSSVSPTPCSMRSPKFSNFR